MKCCSCEMDIPDGAKFCPQCGQSQADVEQLRRRCLADVDECERAVKAGQGSRPYIRQNFDKRLVEWQQAAELVVREAQWLLARCSDEGFGVERNEIHAIGWHLKAAEQGYPPAQNHIGSCYQNGDGVPQDEAEAAQWYLKAAEQGYAAAQANLGWCYDTGSGLAQDESEAAKWYAKAAEQGDYTSQHNLGVHYEWGSGVDQDKDQALQWYRKAAEQGYEMAAEAAERLGDELATETKQGQEKVKEAETRFRRACKEALADGKIELDEKDHLRTLAKSLEIDKETMKGLFAEEKEIFERQRQAHRAKDIELKFRIACKNALADGKVDVGEKDELRTLAESLNIAKEDVKRIFEDERKIFKASQQVQPTREVELQFRKACKKALADGKVTPQEESELKNLARFLKMSNEAMKQVLADEVRIFRESQKAGPTKNAELQYRRACKKVLADGKVTPEEEKQLKSLAVFLKISGEMMTRIFTEEVKLYRQTHPEKPAK